MSWIDKIKNDFIITMGDSKTVFKPNWLNASKSIDYNVAEFNFPNVPGTLVNRKLPMGAKYNLEIYFQGADHLDISRRFEGAAIDNRAWKISHPFYDDIIVQPTSLNFDNSEYNVSKITGSIIETIVDENPKVSIDPLDSIKINKIQSDVDFEAALKGNPSITDINTAIDNNNKNFKLGVPIITIPDEFEAYYQLFNQANTAISTATASPILAMRAIIAVISYPALFTTSVTQRMNVLTTQFANLRSNISGLTSPTSKQIYQNSAGSIISSMCLASATPLLGNYTNSTDSLNVIEQLLNNYNQYIEDLDSLQTLTGGTPVSFVPDFSALTGLNELVTLTVSNLFGIALNSKSERSIITETDTNFIILTHRFYGLDPLDKNIEELMANNNLGLNGILQIKKGTKIVYYI